jgi:release factor glutamine methyltransferase
MTGVAAPVSNLGNARREIARQLRAGGIDTPDLDARLLVGHALGLDHAGLARASGRALAADEIARIEALVARRLAREPVARITGVKEFWGLPLAISPSVLVPRPETETVVERALAVIDCGGSRGRALRIADLGTGSGAIMLALLSELPRAFAIGTDCDWAALAVARGNATRLGLAQRAAFVACDFGQPLAGGFDLLLTNPPYVRSGDIAGLDPDVRDYDPRVALDGGADGLAAYRAIAAGVRALLNPNAHLVTEIGAGQGDAVVSLLAAAGLDRIAVTADLAGISRAVCARREP